MRLCGPRFAVGAALAAALACAGCSYQLDSMFSKPDDDAMVTGSIVRHGAPHPTRDAAQVTAQVSESDLVYARAAAADALAHGGKINSVPWQNPHTGVGGNITPLATSYDQNGMPCRDFLASAMSAGSQAWLQGSACRTASGEWHVKSLKPLKSG